MTDRIPCPFCQEPIHKQARKCQYCLEFIEIQEYSTQSEQQNLTSEPQSIQSSFFRSHNRTLPTSRSKLVVWKSVLFFNGFKLLYDQFGQHPEITQYWESAFWQLESPFALLIGTLFLIILYLVSLIGLWKFKNWGRWLYIFTNIAIWILVFDAIISINYAYPWGASEILDWMLMACTLFLAFGVLRERFH